MEMKADPSRILMSDTLRGQVLDLDNADDVDDLAHRYVTVVAARRLAGQLNPMTGILRTVLFDIEPEIEFRVELSDAFDLVQADKQTFDCFELHHGTRIVNLVGPFTAKAARIQEIDVRDQMCVIALHLNRTKRS